MPGPVPALAICAMEAVAAGRRAGEVFGVGKHSARVSVMAFIAC